eukprot:CAMPEP_0181314204 /NCGR_PEP_ID=MMETSP1101-20121128/14683_1 /TAXON_ID=46948 /ORGANISM="Rhodomonas abbreviata, Strain Caron Lab Isolate" /LENGTH=105 /DNA_ID=CAMNT_0023421261 /DNA_START=125 /DNA_END=442 /DNA_ORIENTATION=+
MVGVGVGFTALCGVSATGQIDKVAEENGWQEKGELAKWQNQNVFNMWDLLDVNDFIEDIKEEVGFKTKAEQAKEDAAADEGAGKEKVPEVAADTGKEKEVAAGAV